MTDLEQFEYGKQKTLQLNGTRSIGAVSKFRGFTTPWRWRQHGPTKCNTTRSQSRRPHLKA